MRKKAISERRDRMQSRGLVSAAVPVFLVLLGVGARQALASGAAEWLAIALGVSVVFAFSVWRLRAATRAAAVAGGAICLAVMLFTGRPGGIAPLRSGLTPLMLLFVLTFAATRLGRERKMRAGLAESRRGRNAAQVLANLGIAAVAAGVGSARVGGAAVAMLAALAEATADTMSSEMGQAFGGTPRMMLTLQRVEAGTDGAISWTGTLAGMVGAAVVAVAGWAALGLRPREALIAWGAGVAGLFIDSLLGATLEQRGWLGNDLVNLASTAFAAGLGWWLARW